MRLVHGTCCYQFAVPFTFRGLLYESGSWIVVYEEGGLRQRFPLNAIQFAEYEAGYHRLPKGDK